MYIVSPGLGHHVHDRAGIAPVFRIEGVGQNAKFRDAVRRRLNGRQVREQVVAVAAVHREVVVAATPTVDRNHSRAVAAITQHPCPAATARPAAIAATGKRRAASAAIRVTARSFTTAPNCVDVVSTSGGAPVTSTVSVAPPTCSAMSTLRTCIQFKRHALADILLESRLLQVDRRRFLLALPEIRILRWCRSALSRSRWSLH